MPIVSRFTSFPPISEIIKVSQIVIVDLTGPAVTLGSSPKSVILVGEFLKGPFVPTRVGSVGELDALFGLTVSAKISQTSAGIQDGSGAAYNGNGAAMLKGKKFKRLAIQRVDMDAVTVSAGSTKATLSIVVTVAVADQDGSGNTNKDILVPGGTRFADTTIGAAVQVVGLSQDKLIPKGTALTANTYTFTANVFFIKTPNPAAQLSAAVIDTVIDAALNNVAATTTITSVTQAGALNVPGTGTNFEDRINNRYLAAIDSTKPGDSDVSNEIQLIWAARRNTLIRPRLSSNAVDSSNTRAVGRMCAVDADPAATSSPTDAAAAKTAAEALGTTESIRNDRVIICFPHTKVFIDDLSATTLIAPSGWMASIVSNFAAELNPGADPEGLLDNIDSLEDAFVLNPLGVDDYAALLAGGVSPLQKDRTVGWWFLDGITAVNPVAQPTRVNINRRRMADEIQENLANIASPYQKKPATADRVDAFVGAVNGYLEVLKSPENLALQRIEDFLVDETSGNTTALRDAGVFVLIVAVKLLGQFKYIVFQTTIGETVTIAQAA